MKVWLLFFIISNAQAFPTLVYDYSDTNNNAAENTNGSLEKVDIAPSIYLENLKQNSTETEDESFPIFIKTGQWREGSALIAFLIGVYCFIFLAIICDKYFLPCIEKICEVLDLSQDVAAATFMAMATSAPEFFVNVIATFVTDSDIGIGTVIGSSLFNTLGVGALGGLAASQSIQVDWWPVTRDCTIYLFSISILIIMAWDGYIYWYEGMVLFLVYFLYFGIMLNNKKLSEAVGDFVKKFSNRNDKDAVNKKAAEAGVVKSLAVYIINEPIQYYKETKEPVKSITEKCKETDIATKRNCQYYFLKVWSIIIFPLKTFLWCLVPNPVTYPKIFPVTFVMCILLIGTNSYVVSWMISIIGHSFQVPDVVLGLTFLAAGGCLPEAVSIIIMSRKGNGRMGVSNALGANSMNILLSLGLPWFIKAVILNIDNVPNKFIELESGSILYTIMGLILVVFSLFIILLVNKFRLSKRTGSILLVAYLVFLSLAIASEILNRSVTS